MFMTGEKGMYSIPLSGQNAGSLFRANLINVTDSIFETNSGPKSGTVLDGIKGFFTGIGILILLCCFCAIALKKKRRTIHVKIRTVAAPTQPPVQPDFRMEDLIAHLQRQAPVQPVQQQFYHSHPDNPPAYQSPTITNVGTPAPQPWRPPQEQVYSADEGQKEFQMFVPPPSKASPRGPALVIQPRAPQALPSTMVQMPDPQTGYYHDAGSTDQQPSSPGSSTYVRPSRTGPSSPQYRG
jgi:hypothetical protein